MNNHETVPPLSSFTSRSTSSSSLTNCFFSMLSYISSLSCHPPFLPYPSTPQHFPLPGYHSLPYELQYFHKYLLQSPKILFIYYFLYFLLIVGFIAFIGLEGSAMYDQSPSVTFYNSYFIFQTTLILLLFPIQLHFLSETLNSHDIPLMLDEVIKYEPKRFQYRIVLLSTINSIGFLISVLMYGVSVEGDPYQRILEIFFFIIILLPLPMCITMSLIIMDCHRRLADKYCEYLIMIRHPPGSSLLAMDPSAARGERGERGDGGDGGGGRGGLATGTSSSPELTGLGATGAGATGTSSSLHSPSSSVRTNSHLFYSNSFKLYDLTSPLLTSSSSSLPFPNNFPSSTSLSHHITLLHSHYLLLRDGYLFTSIHRGTFITILTFNSLLLMGYLLWTVYLFTFSFFSVVGFMSIDLIILIEVFIWTSLANESGHLVKEALADHSLRLLAQEGITIEQIQLLQHLITCLPYARLEIYGIGRITVRFKFAITITVGFAAAIIPKLLM